MITAIIIIHVLVSLGVIAVILLQSGKSAGLSGAITGGAETLFGKKKGMDEFLSKITAFVALGFLLTSLTLSLLV
ncbi:MAG: preprotein translocase subunit SecG [Thermincolia bacterium]